MNNQINIYIHPGCYIKDYIDNGTATIDSLAEGLNISVDETKSLVNGRLDISEKIAEGLSALFGTSKSLWINLQTAYDSRNL